MLPRAMTEPDAPAACLSRDSPEDDGMARLNYIIIKDESGYRLRIGDTVSGPLSETEARRIALRRARATAMSGRTAAVVLQRPDRTLRTEWIEAPFGGQVEA